MRFMGPEESGVDAVSRTPGLLGVFVAGASPSVAASHFEGGGKEAERVGTVAHERAGTPLIPYKYEVLWLFTFFHALGGCCHPGYHDHILPLGRLWPCMLAEDCILPATNIRELM
jgi:hypothetical protein